MDRRVALVHQHRPRRIRPGSASQSSDQHRVWPRHRYRPVRRQCRRHCSLELTRRRGNSPLRTRIDGCRRLPRLPARLQRRAGRRAMRRPRRRQLRRPRIAPLRQHCSRHHSELHRFTEEGPAVDQHRHRARSSHRPRCQRPRQR